MSSTKGPKQSGTTVTTDKHASATNPSKKRKHSGITDSSNTSSSSSSTPIPGSAESSSSSSSSALSSSVSSSLLRIDCSNLQYLSLPLDDNHTEVLRIFVKPVPNLPIGTASSSSSSASKSRAQKLSNPVPSTENDTDLFILSSGSSVSHTSALADTELEAAFAHIGDIQILTRGTLGTDNVTPLDYVIIRFPTAKSRRKILNMTSVFPIHDHDGRLFGLRGWLAAHEASKVDARKLQTQADSIVNKYDKETEEKERKKDELAARMEADGFTLVNHKLSKVDHNDINGTNNEEEGSAAKRKKNRGSLIATDFYRFQQTQDKLNRLNTLKEQFEADKQQIKLIKEKRVFKPY